MYGKGVGEIETAYDTPDWHPIVSSRLALFDILIMMLF